MSRWGKFLHFLTHRAVQRLYMEDQVKFWGDATHEEVREMDRKIVSYWDDVLDEARRRKSKTTPLEVDSND